MVFLVLSRKWRAIKLNWQLWHSWCEMRHFGGRSRHIPRPWPGNPDIHNGNMSYGLLWLNAGLGHSESGDVEILAIVSLTAEYGFISNCLQSCLQCLQRSCGDWRSQTSVMSFVCKHVTQRHEPPVYITSQSEAREQSEWPRGGAEMWGKLWPSLTRWRKCGANEDNLISAD